MRRAAWSPEKGKLGPSVASPRGARPARALAKCERIREQRSKENLPETCGRLARSAEGKSRSHNTPRFEAMLQRREPVLKDRASVESALAQLKELKRTGMTQLLPDPSSCSISCTALLLPYVWCLWHWTTWGDTELVSGSRRGEALQQQPTRAAGGENSVQNVFSS